jgi:hypothetical protein
MEIDFGYRAALEHEETPGTRDYSMLLEQENQETAQFFVGDDDELREICTPETLSRETFVVGDVQGYLEVLKDHLGLAGLINNRGNWSGEQNRLVLMGDLLDRGPNGFSTIDFVLSLQKQAIKAGGELIYIVGNHEQMWMDNSDGLNNPVNGSLNNIESIVGCIEAWADQSVRDYNDARNI